MSATFVTSTKSVKSTKSELPPERYVIGTNMYFEVGPHLRGRLSLQHIRNIFQNPNVWIGETEKRGRSLKVMVDMGSETKFLGFISS